MIFDFTSEYKKREKQWWKVSLAEEKFLSTIETLKSIKGTPWYKSIIWYWEQELLESANFLRDVDASKIHEVAKAQAKFELAQKFTYYINSVTRD